MAWIDGLLQRESAPVLKAGMGFAFQKQLVIANNLANIDTPYYKRQTTPDEEFIESLESAIEKREQDHPQEFTPEEKLDLTWRDNSYPRMRMFNGKENGLERHDENSVVVEQEMANLAKNELKMSAMQQLYRKTMTMMVDAAVKTR